MILENKNIKSDSEALNIFKDNQSLHFSNKKIGILIPFWFKIIRVIDKIPKPNYAKRLFDFNSSLALCWKSVVYEKFPLAAKFFKFLLGN